MSRAGLWRRVGRRGLGELGQVEPDTLRHRVDLGQQRRSGASHRRRTWCAATFLIVAVAPICSPSHSSAAALGSRFRACPQTIGGGDDIAHERVADPPVDVVPGGRPVAVGGFRGLGGADGGDGASPRRLAIRTYRPPGFVLCEPKTPPSHRISVDLIAARDLLGSRTEQLLTASLAGDDCITVG